MDPRQLRRARARRARRQRRVATAVIACALGLGVVTLAGFRVDTPGREPRPAVLGAHRSGGVDRRRHRPDRGTPPQFVVLSFDGAGGERLWTYWRGVARRSGARFTFFVSGVYLLDEARGRLYRPPRHPPGRSDIGFAQADGRRPARGVVRGTLEQIVAAHGEGHEIGTHFNGHFCAPYAESVGEWSSADWRRELGEFEKLLFDASANNDLRPAVSLPFGREEIVGTRTPCLEGKLGALYPVLARRGFRYDSSQVGRLGEWPRRERGVWSVPLTEIPLAGHTFDVIAMDYNFFANQTGAVDAPPSEARSVERETFRSLWRAFRTGYLGNRAPLVLGSHFQTWNHWAYNRAFARFATRACRLPEVRCVTFRELVDWLDAQPRRRLRRLEAGRPSSRG